MSISQLTTLLKFEKNKEQEAARKFTVAETEYQENISRLQGVADYRLEYMKRLNQRSMVGIDSSTYNHYLAFIDKLDYASEQVKIAMNQAKSLASHCKSQWFKQRQKVKAVELLLEKRNQQLSIQAIRTEQKMFDEIATQQYIRRRAS